MKFLSASQIREADAYTIENLPIASIDLMEKAASLCSDWITTNLTLTNATVHVFCGIGNNGGDGLVIARQLHLKHVKVECYIVGDPSKGSEDFKANKSNLEKIGLAPKLIQDKTDFPNANPSPDFIVDALLGTGLTRPAEGTIGNIIEYINRQPAMCIAIDLPSGLFVDQKHASGDLIIKATYTLTFECPKLNFVLPNYAKYVGTWRVLDIGLNKLFIEKQKSDFDLLTLNQVAGYLTKREKFSHKGTYGHAVLIAGSVGKFGAAVMATQACLRSGIGLCTVYTSKAGHDVLQISCPEAMVQLNTGENTLLPQEEYSFFKDKTIGVGPGVGLNNSVKEFFIGLLKSQDKAMVIDADALTFLSQSTDLLSLIPSGSILTPHPKEFKRLFGNCDNDYDLLVLQQKWSVKLKCFIVLKGAHTRISTPKGTFFINQTGNPGMAKGGSGDVLTGILTALLGQGYEPLKAAQLGVFIHGFAGDLAAAELGELAMLPTDLIAKLPEAFKLMKRTV